MKKIIVMFLIAISVLTIIPCSSYVSISYANGNAPMDGEVNKP